MKVVIAVGHSLEDQGAVNENSGVTEYKFNDELARSIKNTLDSSEHEVEIAYRKNGYRILPNEINVLSPDLIVSLHCNAFNTEVRGCEMLYYHKSQKSKNVALIFQEKLSTLMQNNNRGIKSRRSEDRGGYLLKYTNAPCIITEPFFIDNDSDLSYAVDTFNDGSLVTAYVEAITRALELLKQ